MYLFNFWVNERDRILECLPTRLILNTTFYLCRLHMIPSTVRVFVSGVIQFTDDLRACSRGRLGRMKGRESRTQKSNPRRYPGIVYWKDRSERIGKWATVGYDKRRWQSRKKTRNVIPCRFCKIWCTSILCPCTLFTFEFVLLARVMVKSFQRSADSGSFREIGLTEGRRLKQLPLLRDWSAICIMNSCSLPFL